MTTDAGYSGTPLAQKLGFKDGQRVLFIDLPDEVDDLVDSARFLQVERGGWVSLPGTDGWDIVHAFAVERAVLETHAATLRTAIKDTGAVWISWPKKASGVPTDITEDTLREIILPTGLVDVKVCAVNDTWSGLKFSIRRELRGEKA